MSGWGRGGEDANRPGVLPWGGGNVRELHNAVSVLNATELFTLR